MHELLTHKTELENSVRFHHVEALSRGCSLPLEGRRSLVMQHFKI